MVPASEHDFAAVRAEIATMGHAWSPQVMLRTRELHAPLVKALPWADLAPVADIPYGDHPRQTLDVYRTSVPNAPTVIFLHGGGFVAGDKDSDGVFYNNVGRYLAAKGYLTVAANYRLAPDATWPAGAEDAASVVAWVRANASRFGGHADKIVLFGQSAGAAHIASYLFHPLIRIPSQPYIKGAVLMSGFYRASAPLDPGPKAYFGPDESLYAARSAANHVAEDHVPLLLTLTEFDPAVIAVHTLDFATALTSVDGKPPQLVWFEGENHVSTVHGLGLGSDRVGEELCQFFRRVMA